MGLAICGIGVVWNLALFGISRRLSFRAVRYFAQLR